MNSREAVLTATLSLEPRPLDLVTIRVAAIRRVLPAIVPPLELRVVPFRYRVTATSVEPVTPKCHHARARYRARS